MCADERPEVATNGPHDPLEPMRSGPALELPIVYRFTSIPKPEDHVIMHKLLPLEVPEGSFIRGVELGFRQRPTLATTTEGELINFLAGHPDDLGPVVLHVEWSEPAKGGSDVR